MNRNAETHLGGQSFKCSLWSLLLRHTIVLVLTSFVSANCSAGTFRDCSECPEMILVSGGQSLLGASLDEEIQEGVPEEWRGNSPLRKVIISSFAAGIYPITVGQFRKFAEETGFESRGCAELIDGAWRFVEGAFWGGVSFPQTDTHPVVCVSYDDALKYMEWLWRKTGYKYRLLSDNEWEYAARANTRSRRYWGDDSAHSKQCDYANGADVSFINFLQNNTVFPEYNVINVSCDDGYVFTSPVGYFKGNEFGLYDMLGNVMEWTSSCFNYLPTQLNIFIDRNCGTFTLRGGSWADPPWSVRSADRYRDVRENRCMGVGFRVARDLR